MIRILLFEDNEFLTDSFKELIKHTEDMELCATYQTGTDAVRHITYFKPDIVIMDIDMPGKNGLDALRAIRAEGLETLVIMHTVFEDNHRVFQAVCHGASGYLLKTSTPDKILQSIREAKEGGAPMTPSIAKQVLQLFSTPFSKQQDLETLTSREHDVLNLLVKGYSYKMIAADLQLSMETIRFHVKNIYAKLHVHSKSEVVAKVLSQR